MNIPWTVFTVDGQKPFAPKNVLGPVNLHLMPEEDVRRELKVEHQVAFLVKGHHAGAAYPVNK